jgi:hypothetical protein
MTLNELEQLADFYMVDLYDLLDGTCESVIIPENPVHGLHHEDVTQQDFESIAHMGRVIKNYQKMKRLENE